MIVLHAVSLASWLSPVIAGVAALVAIDVACWKLWRHRARR